MKRLILFATFAMVLSGGIFAYYMYGGSPEVKRDRYLKRAQEYLKESKVKEALVEYRNAVKADPRSAQARLELAQVLMRAGDLRGAYGELSRAVELKPDFIKARYELGLLELSGKSQARAKEQYNKLHE